MKSVLFDESEQNYHMYYSLLGLNLVKKLVVASLEAAESVQEYPEHPCGSGNPDIALGYG